MESNQEASPVSKDEVAMSEHYETPVKGIEPFVDGKPFKGIQPFEVLAHTDVNLYDEQGNLRLIPIPSADPNDPLRMPTWRKSLVIVALGFYTAGATAMLNTLSPIIPSLLKYYAMGNGPPPQQMVLNLATYPTLCGGFAAIITVIASRWIGTRPVTSFSAVLLFFSTIWACVSTGKDRGLYSHLAARCFIGLATGAFETMVPLIIQDVNYIHRRNTLIAVVWGIGGITSSVFGALSTYIVNAIGWRWFFGIINIITGIGMVLILFILPETSWTRTVPDLVGTSQTDENGFAEPVRPTGRPRSYLYSLRMVSGNGSGKMAWETFKDLCRCSLFPNIIWVVLLNACMGGTTIATTLVLGSLLQNVYHWKPQNVGLFTVAQLVASLCTIPVTGVLGDQVIKFMARRNRGQHKPEHQLVNLILPVILGFIGTLCYGAFSAHPQDHHWMSLLVMMCLQFFSFFSMNVVTTTYAIECFPDLAGVMTITSGAYRNIIGFGLTYGVSDFVSAVGPFGCFGTYAGILGGLGLAGIIFYFKGPAMREYVSQSKLMKSRAAHIYGETLNQ